MSVFKENHSKLILMTGKGGVGRTFLAKKFKKIFENLNEKVVLLKFPDEDFLIDDIDYLNSIRGVEHFLNHHVFGGRLMTPMLKIELVQNLIHNMPTLREFGWLEDIVSFFENKKINRIIVDLPASGHFLGLVQLPQLSGRFFRGTPLGSAIQKGEEIFLSQKCSTFLVTIPELLPLNEAAELYDELQKSHLKNINVFVNRVPEKLYQIFQKEKLQVSNEFQTEYTKWTKNFDDLEYFKSKINSSLYFVSELEDENANLKIF